jgi:hypothetical protein
MQLPYEVKGGILRLSPLFENRSKISSLTGSVWAHGNPLHSTNDRRAESDPADYAQPEKDLNSCCINSVSPFPNISAPNRRSEEKMQGRPVTENRIINPFLPANG